MSGRRRAASNVSRLPVNRSLSRIVGENIAKLGRYQGCLYSIIVGTEQVVFTTMVYRPGQVCMYVCACALLSYKSAMYLVIIPQIGPAYTVALLCAFVGLSWLQMEARAVGTVR